jgi:iron complex transport system ATP-binding protein
MSVLDVVGITVRKGARVVLDDVSLSVRGGEFLAVIGANGAGKSTLLAVLAGLERPSAGVVRLHGEDLRRMPARALARRRAYLPQGARCEWPISVQRLVALGLTPALPAIGGLPKDYEHAVAAALAACDLSAQWQQPVNTLSGGELARAMLARALVSDPDVLIVDEPLAGLDPRHALDTARRLAQLAATGKTVIAAIHDLTLAARHAGRIVALRGARVVGDGPTAETLTAALIEATFDVKACVSGPRDGLYVDYVEASRPADPSAS